MLILEGPDQVGKTTLAYKLIKRLNDLHFPHIYSAMSKLPACFNPVGGYLPFIHSNVVQDRLHMSRTVYGRVFENQYVNTADEVKLIDAHVRQVFGFTVVITADESWLKSRWDNERPEMYELPGILKVNAEYMNVVQERIFDVDLHFHNTGSSWAADEERIIDAYIAKRRALGHSLHRTV